MHQIPKKEFREEFVKGIVDNQLAFGLDLDEQALDRLADHYGLVLEANPLLHLVAPCGPGEFATRHVLESLTLLEYLPLHAHLADVGTGGGFPSLPCLLVRDDLKAVLIESKERKAAFLSSTTERLGLAGRAEVVNRQFEEADPQNCTFVVSRALDKFTERLRRLIKWSRGRKKLFYGGNNLRDELNKQKIAFEEKLMPLSDQRYLFVLEE